MSKQRLKTKHKPLYSPSHWFHWCLVAILWLIAKLPYKAQLKLGAWLAKIFIKIDSKAKRTAQTNIELCFPDLTPQQKHAMLQSNLESTCISIFETAMAWLAPAHKLQPLLAEIQGLEHIEQALVKGNGVILMGCHFTLIELGMRLLAMKLPYAIMYRRQKNPILDFLKRRAVRKYYQKGVVKEDVRGFLKCLRQNMVVGYTPDTDNGANNSVFVPFFGVKAATVTATARFAAFSKASIIPLIGYRLPAGKGYGIKLMPPLDNYPSGDTEADARRINQTIEAMVRPRPEQYLWVYKRFKTRPAGEARFYK